MPLPQRSTRGTTATTVTELPGRAPHRDGSPARAPAVQTARQLGARQHCRWQRCGRLSQRPASSPAPALADGRLLSRRDNRRDHPRQAIERRGTPSELVAKREDPSLAGLVGGGRRLHDPLSLCRPRHPSSRRTPPSTRRSCPFAHAPIGRNGMLIAFDDGMTRSCLPYSNEMAPCRCGAPHCGASTSTADSNTFQAGLSSSRSNRGPFPYPWHGVHRSSLAHRSHCVPRQDQR